MLRLPPSSARWMIDVVVFVGVVVCGDEGRILGVYRLDLYICGEGMNEHV